MLIVQVCFGCHAGQQLGDTQYQHMPSCLTIVRTALSSHVRRYCNAADLARYLVATLLMLQHPGNLLVRSVWAKVRQVFWEGVLIDLLLPTNINCVCLACDGQKHTSIVYEPRARPRNPSSDGIAQQCFGSCDAMRMQAWVTSTIRIQELEALHQRIFTEHVSARLKL